MDNQLDIGEEQIGVCIHLRNEREMKREDVAVYS